jgi:hypothetical protein
MAEDLSSAELKDPFSRAMKRAVEPPDVRPPRRLLALQLFAYGGLVYSVVVCGGWSQPLGVALFFGSMLMLALCQQIKGLLLRIERLEADAIIRDLRDLGSSRHLPTSAPNPLESTENRAGEN